MFCGMCNVGTAKAAGMPAVPITPLRGPQLKPEDVTGTAIVASRTHVNGIQNRALRIFTGAVSCRQVGDTFDTYHAVNGKDCGGWTVQAIITDGNVISGTINEGIGCYRERTTALVAQAAVPGGALPLSAEADAGKAVLDAVAAHAENASSRVLRAAGTECEGRHLPGILAAAVQAVRLPRADTRRITCASPSACPAARLSSQLPSSPPEPLVPWLYPASLPALPPPRVTRDTS